MQRPRYRPSSLAVGGVRETLTFRGRQYRLFVGDDAVANFLRQLGRYVVRTHPQPRVTALLEFRSDLRAINGSPSIGGLVVLLARGDVLTTRWAIWLLGRSRSKSAVRPLGLYLSHPEPRFRKEAARALRRLGAWGPLAEFAQHDLDPQVRALATPRRLRDAQSPGGAERRFAGALARLYRRRPTDEPAESPPPSAMPYWCAAPCVSGQPPRPDWWLRRILQRVHATIRGSARAGS